MCLHTYSLACAGTANAQALACNSIHAIAASDARHAAVFARAGAIPWLVGLIHQWPCHACGRNAASALKQILQNQDYQVWLVNKPGMDQPAHIAAHSDTVVCIQTPHPASSRTASFESCGKWLQTDEQHVPHKRVRVLQSEACACGVIPALVAMLVGGDADCQASAAALLHVLAAATHTSRYATAAAHSAQACPQWRAAAAELDM